jgi:HAD superfamily hydrolase (TIGR01490 family)
VGGIDFFDVDHTITRHSSGGRFVSLAIRKRLMPIRLLPVIAWYTFTYRVGMFRLREYGDGFSALRGLSRAELDAVARESFDTKLREDLFAEIVSLIRETVRTGRRVVLATSSIDFIVEPLAAFLGVTDVIATRLEFDGDTCTGRILGAPLFRREKKLRVLEYMEEAGQEPACCSFYSDSIYDLPLLQEVGTPVAVNPDFRLRRVARRRGWRVMDLD